MDVFIKSKESALLAALIAFQAFVSFLCCFRWEARPLHVLKHFPHSTHLYGFSCVSPFIGSKEADPPEILPTLQALIGLLLDVDPLMER